MKFGFLFDVHGTLLDSNKAWIEAFYKFGNMKKQYYADKIWNKYSRKQLAKEVGINYDKIKEEYRKNLTVRTDIVNLLMDVSNYADIAIVSNASKEDIKEDIKLLPSLPILRIFSKEDGKKPDAKYFDWILMELNWDKAYLVGNDFEEDVIESQRITSLIVPYSRED